MFSRVSQRLGSQTRSFVTRTAPKRGGDGHVHYVFNTKEKRFSAATSIAVIGGGCLFGVGAIVGAMKFQNKKRKTMSTSIDAPTIHATGNKRI